MNGFDCGLLGNWVHLSINGKCDTIIKKVDLKFIFGRDDLFCFIVAFGKKSGDDHVFM